MRKKLNTSTNKNLASMNPTVRIEPAVKVISYPPSFSTMNKEPSFGSIALESCM